ncbi:MAG: carotenoid 1,2-hydratase [Burkholderiaceae bacterium]|nr:carotenoid 1,2-hydratase [Burkholderiaceae bacterium]
MAPWWADATANPAAPMDVQPRPLVFPADHGAHPASRIEWWYVTGWVSTDPPAAGAGSTPTDRCGFQVTFFRSRTAVAANHPSRFAATQLLFAHAALTDLAQGRLRHDQRVARSGFGIAEAAAGDTAVSLRDWSLVREAHQGGSRYRARLASDSAGFAFDFTIDTTQALLLQGDAGHSRKGPKPAQASHYYSQPQLAVAGTLTRDGVARLVHGTAWLDHEWSDSLLDASAVGWDWIGMNLADGSALTAFQLRSADGDTVYAGGSFRPAGGATRNFGADEVRFVPGRVWASPASRARYPVAWTISTPVGRYTVRSLLDAQELDSRASTGSIYWEGLSELQDDRGHRIGLGYLEMTGYAGRLSL